jgi:iron(III) transport system permease protein
MPDPLLCVRRFSIPLFERAALVFCLAALGLTVLYPTARLAVEAARSWQMEALLCGAGYAALRNTLVIGLASVLTSGLLGSTLALVFARYSFPGHRVLAALAYLPFALPPLVGVLSFYYLIGRDGVLTHLCRQLGFGDVALGGPAAILLIHTYSFYVFFYAMVSAALVNLDRAQIEAARTLGASRARVFFRVTLPMLRPSILGASLLTFMSSGASFSAPYFFGQDFPLLSVQIFNERTQFHNGAALTLTVVLALIALFGLVLFRSAHSTAGVASKGVRTPVRSRAGRLLVSGLAWVSIGVLLIPHAAIVWLSLVDHRAWQTEIVPTTFTWANYTALFRDPGAFAPIRNSLWMSAAAAVMTLLVALPAAYLAARKRPFGRTVNLLVMLPWALPGTVIAMNLIVAFNDPWLPVYNTVWMLPLAYFVRNVPLLTRMASAAIEPFDATLIEAGRTLGASRAFCFRHIVAPLLAPAIAAGTALVFAACLGEFVASILLYLPANIPIAVQINMAWRGSVGTAFAYSVFLMLLVSATFYAARRVSTRFM